ncbi:unnamed protein product [Pedinophyceae sp. YPF-701]|nr:unnamed protein product [Pedinophyceae sp. YPF-701]
MVGPFMGDPLMWLMGANVAVFGCWHVLHPSFMRKHFLLSEQNIKAKRYHTVITSAFSHNDLSHLGANMFALFFMGRFLASYSPQVLLMTYFACGVGGSLVFLVHQRMQRRGLWEMYTRPYGSSALGASGAVNGISTAVAVLAPMSQILLFPLPVPMPLFVATALIMSRDLWGMYDGKGSNVAHSAHIGGAAVGAALGLLLRARVL